MRISPSNNSGFTLVELMVAMLIMVVGLMGLLQTLNVTMEYGLRNQLRDEAVLVGEKAMSFQKVRPFDQLSTNHPPLVNSQLRSGRVQYKVTCEADPLSLTVDEKTMTVRVEWNYKGSVFTHEVRSNRSR